MIKLAILTLLAGCAAEPTTAGDPLGVTDDKADETWWKPERALATASAPLQPGDVLRGTFSPDVYAGAAFYGEAGATLQMFTRSWLGAGLDDTWETAPFVFAWRGGGAVNDWASWSM